MVEHDDDLGLDEQHVGHAQLVGVRVGQALVATHQVVRRVPHRTGPERGQLVGALGGADDAVPQDLERIAAAVALDARRRW